MSFLRLIQWVLKCVATIYFVALIVALLLIYGVIKLLDFIFNTEVAISIFNFVGNVFKVLNIIGTIIIYVVDIAGIMIGICCLTVIIAAIYYLFKK